MYYGGWGWRPYVSVAQRQAQAMRKIAQLKKKGRVVSPVEIEGRGIATTFWGKAWCENLERYGDYANRLPRGRTYVRNGSVIDLQIAFGEVKALVSGSSIYKVAVKITPVSKARWKSICKDCAGAIDSLVELLQGRFSKGVMERICRENNGLFPSPKDIQFSCSCPDWAYMCKHVAAVLYGIGAGKEEIPGKFCLPAIFLNSSDWILLKAAHAPPHCLQLAQVRTRVRRKCEGASRLSVPAGDSGRDKPSADVFSLFSLLLLACS